MTLKMSAEARTKASNKPIPKTFRAWFAEVSGVADFSSQRPRLKEANGIAWFKSMAEYYRNRLIVLGENPPANLPKKASALIVAELIKSLD